MKLQHILLATFFIFALSITACKEEAPTEQEPAIDLTSLPGEWTIVDASMNEKPAERLQGGTFNFIDDKNMTIGIANFPGVTEGKSIEYTLEEMVIKTKTSFEFDFTIVSLDTKSMVLESKIQGQNFVFTLEK